MALANTFENTSADAGFLRRFLARIGNALLTAGAASNRMQMLEKLQAKSDAELASMGLRREDIARHVFRDCGWL